MRRSVLAAATIALLPLLGACGGGDGGPDGTSASASGGSDGADASDTADTDDGADEVLDTCAVISVEEVGTILGGTFTSELGPFDACEFDQEDPRATSFSLDAQPESELGGGFDVYRSGSKSALTDAQQVDVPGIGDKAFITTGTFGDGTNIQLQAATLVDGQVLTVSLTQASDIAQDVLVDQATQLLTLIAAKV
ncbi:hypothetical protein [Aeromicrobium fastidiosum]|uniref:DUF3558 domain-containing protein n=1 Tax=Aeromicrobium fastidiosum TaxID=52699 RepID=A0A641AU10_9ACTN|nr:hypothetical protein [Aeromicrobium fastidiosum]KAA1380723.1 hypothetical protein ESP62_006050 [Aeromicrobium fastidiosum]MBP2390338.1 hypothetical protein [Aeromicrobium fastidiosum]